MLDLTPKLIKIFESAARCDRFLPGLKPPTSPGMYSILDVVHNRNEHGAYRSKMKLRATGQMLACWDLAIDLLLLVENEQRQIIWSRANKYSFSEIGRRLGYERRKLKTLYLNSIFEIEKKVIKNKDLFAKIDKIY